MDACAFETSKLSLPFTDDETLQSTVEADRQIVAVQTENPTFVEAEYPSDEMMPPSNVILVEPELGAFVPLLETFVLDPAPPAPTVAVVEVLTKVDPTRIPPAPPPPPPPLA